MSLENAFERKILKVNEIKGKVLRIFIVCGEK